MKVHITLLMSLFSISAAWSQQVSLPIAEYAKNAVSGKSPSEGWAIDRDKFIVSRQTKSNDPVYIKASVIGSAANGCSRIRIAVSQKNVLTTSGQLETFNGGWDMDFCNNGALSLYR